MVIGSNPIRPTIFPFVYLKIYRQFYRFQLAVYCTGNAILDAVLTKVVMTPEPPRPKRLFLALWPTAAEQAQFHELARQHRCSEKNRLVAAHRLHLTLCFLGAVGGEVEVCVRQMAGQLVWQAFELGFDRLGWFGRPRVLWAGCSTVPTELNDLVARIQAGLKHCGIEFEQRKYQPHITLARKVNRPPGQQTIKALTCYFEKFSLVETRLDENGGSYTTLASWPVRATDAT